jgi:hypothetical protein
MSPTKLAAQLTITRLSPVTPCKTRCQLGEKSRLRSSSQNQGAYL